MIGLGARDTLDDAVAFRSRWGGASLIMLWDETGASWRDFEVLTQPAFVLLDRQGRTIGRWSRWSPDAVIAKLDAL